MEDKLINTRRRWYKHISRMNKDRYPQKVMNMKIKGKCPRGRKSG
jgi:hypothetical protein